MRDRRFCPSCRLEFSARSGKHLFCSATCRERLTPNMGGIPWRMDSIAATPRGQAHLPFICGVCKCFTVFFTNEEVVGRELVCKPCYRSGYRGGQFAAEQRLLAHAANEFARTQLLRARPLLPVPDLLAAGLVLLLHQGRRG